MDITVKDAAAAIEPGSDDAEHPTGTFDVVLSTPARDRDGEEVKADEWVQPLPERIPFDADHGMSVATTVGSGEPWLDDAGRLRVTGTFAATQLAQDVRSLVRDGHITATSVAFLRRSEEKSAGVTRELLNGAFVAIPANPQARVLAAKEGRRNRRSDAELIQAMHDHSVTLGASCGKGLRRLAGDESAVRPSASSSGGEGGAGRSVVSDRKDADQADADDPGALAQATDAALDEAIDLLADVDTSALPGPVQQALGLLQAADESIDALLDALGVPDPDEDTGQDAAAADDQAAVSTAAAASAAADLDLRRRRYRALTALA